ncbi:MAG TPA: hypothetical protein VIV11_00475 [Kofleriaceae bacterium]
MRFGGAVLLVCAFAGHAGAQPGVTPAAPPAPPIAAPQSPELSESAALWLGIGGTAAAYGLFVGGLAWNNASDERTDNRNARTMIGIGVAGTFIAPSVGHWYAGTLVTKDMLRRFVGAGGVLVGGITLAVCDHVESDCVIVKQLAWGAVIAGAGLFVFGTLDDIARAPGRVRKANAQRGAVSLVPTLGAGRGGLAIVGTF